MMTPAKGDYASLPLNPAGRAAADTWDPARDEAAGEQCRAYAAPAIMRVPGRVRVSWQDDYTLKIETDAGTQTRLFRFQRPDATVLDAAISAPGQRSWQGSSVARWETAPEPFTGGNAFPRLRDGLRPPPITGSLEVTTNQIRPGYLRKNGVPFSEDTVVNEYYDVWQGPAGQSWFTVMTTVRDPKYLRQPLLTTTDFKKEPDASKWDPTPCQSR
jgi:hypothetical protein